MQKLLSEDDNMKEMAQENCDNLLPLLCHHHHHLPVAAAVVTVTVVEGTSCSIPVFTIILC